MPNINPKQQMVKQTQSKEEKKKLKQTHGFSKKKKTNKQTKTQYTKIRNQRTMQPNTNRF